MKPLYMLICAFKALPFIMKVFIETDTESGSEVIWYVSGQNI
jgi:hypothetical protein